MWRQAVAGASQRIEDGVKASGPRGRSNSRGGKPTGDGRLYDRRGRLVDIGHAFGPIRVRRRGEQRQALVEEGVKGIGQSVRHGPSPALGFPVFNRAIKIFAGDTTTAGRQLDRRQFSGADVAVNRVETDVEFGRDVVQVQQPTCRSLRRCCGHTGMIAG
jgi:hypothetical protein